MLIAALVSAWPTHPHTGLTQANTVPLRLAGSRCPHRWQVCEVPGAGTFTTCPPRSALLYSSRVTVRPHAWPLIDRFRPAFWATFLPGAWIVPLADVTMLRMASSSTLITANVPASSVVVWCCQSTALRLAFARSRAIWW